MFGTKSKTHWIRSLKLLNASTTTSIDFVIGDQSIEFAKLTMPVAMFSSTFKMFVRLNLSKNACTCGNTFWNSVLRYDRALPRPLLIEPPILPDASIKFNTPEASKSKPLARVLRPLALALFAIV